VTIPKLIIAASKSGSGKTTLALGLMRALTRRGLRVAAVKCGPDYIDPAFHGAATRRQSYNIDSWAMSEKLVASIAHQATYDADILIAEGAMGLFDGAPNGLSGTGSSADIAKLMDWPVLLIHDVSGQAQTSAAVISGLASYDSQLNVLGVILNRIGSERHYGLVASAIEKLNIPLLGAFPRDEAYKIPERHLGLIQAHEINDLDQRLNALSDLVESRIDIDRLLSKLSASSTTLPQQQAYKVTPPAQRIAIARDDAFSFFYPHLASAWRKAGADLIFFSPLADEAVPEACDLCWLPGGYPELHAEKLSHASKFKASICRFAESKPVHGECGGYMVLGDVLTEASGVSFQMLGLINLHTSFHKRKLHLGYRRAKLTQDHCLGAASTSIRGHEFHYATIEQEIGTPFVLVSDAYSNIETPAGLRIGNVSGSFFHFIA